MYNLKASHLIILIYIYSLSKENISITPLSFNHFLLLLLIKLFSFFPQSPITFTVGNLEVLKLHRSLLIISHIFYNFCHFGENY
jgi:hypothetical protein